MLKHSQFTLDVSFFVRHENFLHPKLGNLQEVSRESVHIYTMMRNLHVDGWRQAKRRQTESLETMTSPPAIPPTQENHVELNRLLARVMSLPDDQRVALILVSVEGFTYREAAQTLGVPEGTILSRVSRARAALRGATAETAPRLRSVT
ncbi:MAG TPA: sigma-70 family RNA polymerase sigma factor [Roseobacter sp.]|nr:sigma-70 family RNA polymerase sigma factor [Roseobacter sp.]